MNWRWLLSAALALVVVVLLTEWYTDSIDKAPQVATQPTDPADGTPLAMQWRYGIAQQYKVLSESSMQMQATVQGASSIYVHILGRLDALTL
jgi:hypothetical protein